MNQEILNNYMKSLVDRFFKILPLKESNEDTLCVYMKSLQSELVGFKELFNILNNDASFMSLIAILQYLIDNAVERCSTREVKREVFKAISICNSLRAKYANMEGMQ